MDLNILLYWVIIFLTSNFKFLLKFLYELPPIFYISVIQCWLLSVIRNITPSNLEVPFQGHSGSSYLYSPAWRFSYWEYYYFLPAVQYIPIIYFSTPIAHLLFLNFSLLSLNCWLFLFVYVDISWANFWSFRSVCWASSAFLFLYSLSSYSNYFTFVLYCFSYTDMFF